MSDLGLENRIDPERRLIFRSFGGWGCVWGVLGFIWGDWEPWWPPWAAGWAQKGSQRGPTLPFLRILGAGWWSNGGKLGPQKLLEYVQILIDFLTHFLMRF